MKGEIHVKENKKAVESDSQEKYSDLVYLQAAMSLMPQVNKLTAYMNGAVNDNIKYMSKFTQKIAMREIKRIGAFNE
jgi:hypothetical protein